MDNPFETIAKRLTNIEDLLLDLKHRNVPTSASVTTSNIAPILSADQVREMTGWPKGTFYAKVSAMPEGVVIRGKSRRLLFDREKFMQWLQTPVQA